MIVFGIDPGFASIGLAVLESPDWYSGYDTITVSPRTTTFTPAKVDLRSVEVYRTKRNKTWAASADNVRRAQLIAQWLGERVVNYRPSMLCVEAMSFSRDAGASHKLGITRGVIACVAQWHSLVYREISPQDIKKHLTGKKTASKEEMIAEVELRHPEIRWPKQTTLWEHAADAVGAALGSRPWS